MLDLLITGGLVIDGTGNPGYYGAVGIEGERVRLFRGALDGVAAHRTIDATGRVVCPGFIDMHAHSGLMILAEPRHEPKVRQGVTTEVIGIDGCSYAPFPSPEDLEQFIEVNAGLDGCPPLPGRWSTVEQYLDLFTNRVAVNIVYLVGNSPLRVCAVGWDDRPPTPAELKNQRALLRTAMEEGAWGMSTGLDYPPGSFADTDELVALSEEASRLGGIYHTHVRYSLGDRFLDPVPGGDRHRPPRRASPRTSRTFTSGRRRPAGRHACWRWSRMRAPRGWTSPSTAIPMPTARPVSTS